MAMKQVGGSRARHEGLDHVTPLVDAIERQFQIRAKVAPITIFNMNGPDTVSDMWFTISVPAKWHARVTDFVAGWDAGHHEGRLDMRGAMTGETREDLARKGIS